MTNNQNTIWRTIPYGAAILFYFLLISPTQAQWSLNQPSFMMPEVNIPVFRTDTFDITRFGARGDGITNNTIAIDSAIMLCSVAGGGVVLIPPGLWLTGPIKLQSNVNLHTETGAMILFSPKLTDYPLIQTYYEGQKTWRCQSPISANGLKNVAITGDGIFDGSGDSWRPVKKSKLTSSQWTKLVKSGGIIGKDGNTWYPSESSQRGNNANSSGYLGANASKKDYENIRDFLRPVMVSLINCQTIMLDGPTFQNSPSWCIHPLMCEHLTVRNVVARNPWYAQNGDGIDIESCSKGTVDNCSFDVGDDGICIKSGRDEEGRKRAKPTEYFSISNCTVFHGHGGFVIGSEMSGGVKNIVVSNCTFLGTDIGLRFKSTRGRGGVVENIYIRDISMINIPTDAIRFDMFYGGTSPLPEPDEKQTVEPSKDAIIPAPTEATPQFRNFYLKNIRCNGADQAIFIQGLPEMSIENIEMDNLSLRASKGMTLIDAKNIRINNIYLQITKGNCCDIRNGKSIHIDEFTAANQPGKVISLTGKGTDQVYLRNKKGKLGKESVEISNEVNSNALTLE